MFNNPYRKQQVGRHRKKKKKKKKKEHKKKRERSGSLSAEEHGYYVEDGTYAGDEYGYSVEDAEDADYGIEYEGNEEQNDQHDEYDEYDDSRRYSGATAFEVCIQPLIYIAGYPCSHGT